MSGAGSVYAECGTEGRRLRQAKIGDAVGLYNIILNGLYKGGDVPYNPSRNVLFNRNIIP